MKTPSPIPRRSKQKPRGNAGKRNRGATGTPRERLVRPDGSLRRVTPEDHARMVALLAAGRDVESVARETGFNRGTVERVRDVGVPKLGLRPAAELVREATAKAQAKATDKIAARLVEMDSDLAAVRGVLRALTRSTQNHARPHLDALNAGRAMPLAVHEEIVSRIRDVAKLTAELTRAQLGVLGVETPLAQSAVSDRGDAARRRWDEMTEPEMRAAVADGLRGMGLRVVDDGAGGDAT